MNRLDNYKTLFQDYLQENMLTKEPINLYEPADYILSIGGKRLRPIFALLACDIFGQNPKKALKAAMAVEVFHNFTLLHDDVIDASDLRRGFPTVHKKYNLNTAILSGDMMMIQAYQNLLDYDDPILVKSLLDVFNKMALDVCEGQQYDIDFESRHDVTIGDYLNMIALKTSVLIACSAQMGGIIAGADDKNQNHLYEFARNFGVAFQLQDDILDIFGVQAVVGKKIGSDIVNNKKTYLFLKSLELASADERKTLEKLYFTDDHGYDEDDKINEVTTIFKNLYVVEHAKLVIEAYRDLAISHISACDISDVDKDFLKKMISTLIFREQ